MKLTIDCGARTSALILLIFFSTLSCVAWPATDSETSDLLREYKFSRQDSILVLDAERQVQFGWLADEKRTPASVIKLVTALLAINKWGLEHKFKTRFYWHDNALWVEGLGDPMLISEELDVIANNILPLLPDSPSAINLDSSLFADPPIPGRGKSNDPYNAPLSALAVNFNTLNVRRVNGVLQSAEPQTPLTQVAQRLAAQNKIKTANTRINLRNARFSQQQFGEILMAKLGVNSTVQTNQKVPAMARLIYTHENSHTLAEVLRGALEYSNNFIANQLFLLLIEGSAESQFDFGKASVVANKLLERELGWTKADLHDGAGLSRDNKLSAWQVAEVLQKLAPHKHLLKEYPLTSATGSEVRAWAKSGTLTGIHTLAGYLVVDEQEYQFVFLFERPMPFRYREGVLQSLATQLALRGRAKQP